MANINDYLKWRGDIKFSNLYPFNEIDSMILARFSYLLFSRIKMNKVFEFSYFILFFYKILVSLVKK